ncbi:MAG: LysR family transcriptional regulator [Xanthobacteraceae bacterium]|nr:LysR family transcriptional regulator [Xanthobacteraceae bacterium]
MIRNAALDPSLLQAFVAVAQHQSFTRAAAALNRTQSAVSTQIRRLEEQVGLRLLERSTTRVALSPAGEKLVGYAHRILSLGEEAVQRLHEHEVQGRVRLGVMDDYGTAVLPALLRSFTVAYPNILIEMTTGLTSGMVDRIGSDFDIVIAMHPAGETAGTSLCREQAVWAASDLLDIKTCNPLPVALYPPGCLFRKWALDALDRSGRTWRLAFVSHSLSAVEAVATKGLAVTVVKESMLPASLSAAGAAHGLPRLPKADIRLHTASPLSPAGSLLAAHVREYWRSPAR